MANPRTQYSSIFDRPELTLPEGARVVVWPVINVEEWDINEPMARTVLPTPQNVNVAPDVANFGWFDYGLRIGFWRLKEVLDRHEIRATVSLNASICNSYPEIVRRSLDVGWEMLAHSFIQRVINKEPNERETIQRSIKTIEAFTGQKVRGWMGPGLAETFHTPDILSEEGIEYVADWCNDDQPYELKVKTGRLVALPYTLELNDIPIYMIQHHRSSEIFERARDQFDTLYRESTKGARIMCISTHPYISGVPHRIKYYEMIFDYIKQFEGVVFMTGSEILDWYNSTLQPN
jgi:peptidoglycan/xylan/chitin deacetylase (PgdA/CDA1 family)